MNYEYYQITVLMLAFLVGFLVGSAVYRVVVDFINS